MKLYEKIKFKKKIFNYCKNAFIIPVYSIINTFYFYMDIQIINPFIQEYLVSFTWLGLSMNVFELFYVIWFIEYFEDKKEEYDEKTAKKRENSTTK